MKILTLFLFLLLVPQAHALNGVDYLAGVKYCDTALSAHPQGWAAGFFLDIFGNADGCIERFAASGKAPLIRVHMRWDDAHRYDRFMDVVKKAPRMQALAVKYPSVKFMISGATEHKLSGKDSQKLYDALKKAAPNCEIVNNSLINVNLKGAINEAHGANPRRPGGRYIISMDGTSIDDIDLPAWKSRYRDAEVLFVWDWQLNLKKNKNDKTPRDKRKVRPSVRYIQNLVQQLDSAGAPVSVPPTSGSLAKVCRNNIKPVGSFGLWKPASQDSGGSREGKPVAISKSLGEKKTLSILNSNGGQIGTLGYYGSYGKGLRYYSGWKGGSNHSAKELQSKAQKTAGNPATYIKWGGGCVGPFLATQRTGGL
jgi:hypothetical protein